MEGKVYSQGTALKHFACHSNQIHGNARNETGCILQAVYLGCIWSIQSEDRSRILSELLHFGRVHKTGPSNIRMAGSVNGDERTIAAVLGSALSSREDDFGTSGVTAVAFALLVLARVRLLGGAAAGSSVLPDIIEAISAVAFALLVLARVRFLGGAAAGGSVPPDIIEAISLRGAYSPVVLRAVCFVRAMGNCE